MQEFDVIVVGAGAAGIAAARELVQRGVTHIKVLESRQRVGGRAWSVPVGNAMVDLGGQWVHHSGATNPVCRVARELRVQLTREQGVGRLFDGVTGKPLPVEVSRRSNQRVHQTVEAAAVHAEKLRDQHGDDNEDGAVDGDVSVLEGAKAAQGIRWKALRQAPRSASQADVAARSDLWYLHRVEQPEGGAVDQLSCCHWEEGDQLSGPDMTPIGSYASLVQKAASGMPIETGVRVHTIRYPHDGPCEVLATRRAVNREGAVAGEAEEGEGEEEEEEEEEVRYQARRLVVTLPLGVLKSGRVRFDPPLPPPKQRAIERLGIGLMNKVVLRFSEPFWEGYTSVLGITTPRIGDFEWFYALDRSPWNEPVLVCFLSAAFAWEAERMSDEEVRDAVVARLGVVFGEERVRGALQQMWVTRWGSDPHSLGSWAFLRVGSCAADCRALAQSVDDRVFFAGEATLHYNIGCIDSAWQSGLDAAKDISALEGRQQVV